MSESRVRADGLDSEKWQAWEPILKRFDRAWQQGSPPVIDDFLPNGGCDRGAVLIELVHADLEHRLKAGKIARVETYLERYPELGCDREVALALIEAEHTLRRRREPGLSAEEYCVRFPQYREALTARLPPPEPVAPASVEGERGDTPVEGELCCIGPYQPPVSTTKPKQDAPVIPGYQILSKLDEGGMGEVWRAQDPDFHRTLAIKVVLKKYRGDADMANRLLEEAQITGQLQHPCIVPVHNVGRLDDGRPFFTMKLVKGRKLDELLKENRTLADLPRFLAIFEQVCQAVAYAHSRDVIHRDLKPLNVMVGAFGEVQVMDWGLAKVLDRERATDASSPPIGESTIRTVRTETPGLESQAGMAMGTLAYIAPEQARGLVDQLDERCDVFGLGAMLCEILTGKPPYLVVGRTPEEVHLQAAQGDLTEAFARLDSCGADAELVQLTKKCLAREPEARLRDGKEVAESVTAYLVGVQERLHQAELERKAAQVKTEEERRRRKLTVALAGAGLLVLCLAGGGAWWYQQDQALREAQRNARIIVTVRDVSALLEKADDRIKEGWKRAENLESWQLELRTASAALDQAEALLKSGEPTEELTDQVRMARAQLKEAEADYRSAGQIEHILARMFESRIALRLQYGEAADQIAQVFNDRGMDVLTTDKARVVEWLQKHPRREQLLGILETWAAWTPEFKKRDRLTKVILDVDPSPNALRIRWRQALFRKDKEELIKMASDPMVATLPPMALVLMSMGLMAVDADKKAISVLKEAHIRFPGDYWINLHLGQALANGKPAQPEEAIPYLTAAVALRHQSALPSLELGNAFEKKGDFEGALRCFSTAVQLEPTYALAYNNWGIVLKRKGDVDEGIKKFLLAIQHDPKLALAHSNLSNAYQQKGNPKEAILFAENALQIDPRNVSALINLGVAHHAKRDRAKAIEYWDKALKIDPINPPALTNLGVAWSEVGDYEEATRYYHRAIDSDDTYAMAHCNLGLARLKLGQFYSGLQALERGHDLGSKQPDWRYPSAEWVKKARYLVTLDEKFSAALLGETRPQKIVELMELAHFGTHQKQFFAATAKLLLEAFEAQPTWVDDQKAVPRYYAACCAVMASSGNGVGAACLTAEDRARWRQQALVWLREELAATAKQLENSNPEERNAINRKLQYWKVDGWLSGVRDGQVGQTDTEREEWRKFWSDVNALLKRTREAK